MNLIEAAFAAAIVAIVSGATLQAAVSATRAAAGDPIRDALLARASDELRAAVDIVKYQGTAILPNAIATSVPLPAGTPLPVRLSIATLAQSGGIAVTVTASDLADPAETAVVASQLNARAPLPGTRQQAAGLVPAPTGAP